jgi:Cys-tRNA(Pro)/Cys-tRNA(Cys) deacylase
VSVAGGPRRRGCAAAGVPECFNGPQVADAERATGYVAGGISPLGQRKALPTVIDDSALVHQTIFVSGGRRGLEIELPPADLQRLTRAASAPIARPRD